MNAPKRANRSAPVTPGARTKVPQYSSPAIQQLASESPEFERQFIAASPWYQKLLETTQREIVALPDVKSLLERLDGRIRRERVLKHVVGFVLLEEAPWRLNLQ
jgi:hypothetical protein